MPSDSTPQHREGDELGWPMEYAGGCGQPFTAHEHEPLISAAHQTAGQRIEAEG